jgi:carboxypeptidase D
MLVDYAINYTFPWNLTDNPSGFPFNVYYIPDALNPKVNVDASVFLNDPTVRAALHAPTSKNWTLSFNFPFGAARGNDPSPMPSSFLNALAANATSKGVGIVLYSGNADALVPHLGTEVAIQNTTFGGIQGFTRKPSTPLKDKSGNFAGVIHQERGWTYALFYNAGHMVPRDVPDVAHAFFSDFVFGDCKLGSVISPTKGVTVVVGGEDPLLEGVIRGQDQIYYGFGATQSTYVFPKATREAWKTFNAAYQPAPTG